MRTPRLQPKRRYRLTAWFIATLLLWMGTGGVLRHADDLRVARSSSSTAVLGQATAPSAPAGPCAACEWTQGLQTGTAVFCRVVLPVAQLRPRSLPLTVLLLERTPFLRPLRAPPVMS